MSIREPHLEVSNPRYRPAIDGLRAVAVLSVMLYHSTLGWAPGGFLGVDVFFVLSGYLITGLLMAEHQKWGSIDPLGFYRARARRLLPALSVVVIAAAVLGPRLLSAGAQSALRGDAIASLFYVANWRFIVEKESYFQQYGDPSPLRHLWTLAIEEQYYIAFPLVLIALLSIFGRNRRVLATVLGALALCSAAWGAVLVDPSSDPSRVYYGTDTRIHELLVGAVLAMLLPLMGRAARRRHAWRLDRVGILAVMGVLAAFVVGSETATFTFRGGTVLFSLLTVVVIVAVEVAPRGLLARVLARPTMTWVGRLSYGLYLWHWPVFVVLSPARTGWSGVTLFVLQVTVTFVIASASYYVVEQPIRRGGLRRVGRLRGRLVAALSVPVALSIVMFGTASVTALPPAAQSGSTTQFQTGDPHAEKRILLIGDSVAFNLGYHFRQSTYPDVAMTGRAGLGCGTLEQWLSVNDNPQTAPDLNCEKQFGSWEDAVAAARPQMALWLIGAWDIYDHYIDSKILRVGTSAYADHLTARMEEGLKALGDTSNVVIPNVPCYGQPHFLVEGEDMAPDRNDPKRRRELNRIISDFAARHRGRVHILDVDAWVCPGGKYVKKLDGVEMRYDGVHYTEAGSTKFWAWIMPQLQPFLKD